jgi:hypothetical protein
MDDAMTPDCPPQLRRRHIQLPREPASAAAGRRQVRAAIRAWRLPVDPDIAVLLASDLITSVITAGTGPVIALAVSCPGDHLRIGVSDTSWTPWPTEALAVAKARPGLALVAALSADWACYRTSGGPAAYFTLTFVSAPERVKVPACPDGLRSRRRRAVVAAGRG